MNALELKEKRKECGFTQQELANLIGVSLKTIVNYEKGEVIPITKHEILRKALQLKNNQVNEETLLYQPITGYDKKINNILDQIKAREEIIILSNNDPSTITHQNEMIKLLRTQIEIIEEAKANHKEE